MPHKADPIDDDEEYDEFDEGELPEDIEEPDDEETGSISIEDFWNATETVSTSGESSLLKFLKEHKKAYTVSELVKVSGKSRVRTLGILKGMMEAHKIDGKKLSNTWYFHAQLNRA